MKTTTFEGLGELQKPGDLVKKLRHDLERMETSPFDQYAAFDFFITANSIVDWLYPDTSRPRDNEEVRRSFREKHALLRVTSHIADGSKHFRATSKNHCSVTGTEKLRFVDEYYLDPEYLEGPLLIHLAPAEEQELGLEDDHALSLAREVLNFWIRYIPDASKTD
jgi:hypothetical protein